MLAAQAEVLRRFNRAYTQRIGVLEESFLGLGMPLACARLLFEVAVGAPDPDAATAATAAELRHRLGLDSGYLSRLLRRLESRGLVEVVPDPADRRRRLVRLSPAGRQTLADLEQRSAEVAGALLGPLSERQRARLTEALGTADLLVRAATVHLDVVHPDAPAARAAVGAYVAELDRRFPRGFDPGPADEAWAAPDGRFLLATSDGEPVACGGLQRLDAEHAEIKRMWVAADWRGAGLGARLLRRLEEEAVALGHTVVRLDTNLTLSEAVGLYERAGYRRIARYNDNPYAEAFFAKDLAPPLR